MNDADRTLLQLVNRRVVLLNGQMQKAYTRAIEILRKTLQPDVIIDLIERGLIDQIISDNALDAAAIELREQIQETMARGFQMTLKDLPTIAVSTGRVAAGVNVGPTIRVFFDVINPRVQRAIQLIETPAISTLRVQVRQTVRNAIQAGIEDRKTVSTIARELRSVIGIAPNQERYVINLERQLRAGDLAFAERKLLSKATVGSLRKLIEAGKPIPEVRIQSVVAAYKKKWIATNTDLNARLLTQDSYRAAKRESYAAAIEQGMIDAGRAQKTWVHFDFQDHPRKYHELAQGLTVPFEEEYVLQDQSRYMSAGEGDYNCRCTDRYSMRPATRH